MGIRFKTNQKCVPLHYGGTWVVIYLSPLVLLPWPSCLAFCDMKSWSETAYLHIYATLCCLCATCRVTMRAIKHSEGSSSYCFNGNTKILYPYHQLACIFSRAHKKCFCAYGQKTELWGDAKFGNN